MTCETTWSLKTMYMKCNQYLPGGEVGQEAAPGEAEVEHKQERALWSSFALEPLDESFLSLTDAMVLVSAH